MASEPERPIEKLLRDAARKRQDEAPAGFELHPATRRLLQGEVARQYARQERSAASGLGWLRRLSPGFRWGLAGAAVCALIAVVVIPSLTRDSEEQLLARNESSNTLKTRSVPAERTLSAPATPAPTLTDEGRSQISGTRSDLAARETDSAKFAAAAASRASAKSEKKADFEQATTGSAVAFPDKALSLPAPGAVSAKDNLPLASNFVSAQQTSPPANMFAGAAQNSTAPAPFPAMVAPSAAPASAALGGFNMDAAADSLTTKVQLVQRFVRSNPTTTYAVQNATGLEQRLLVSFQVEQNGAELRVKDEDGSVYRGYLQPAQGAGLRDSLAGLPQTAAAGRTALRKQANAPGSSLNSLPTQAQNYFFRVSGTNQTLRAPVLFTGSISNPPGSTQTPLSGAKISGRVRVGAQREFEVLALPVPAASKTGDGK